MKEKDPQAGRGDVTPVFSAPSVCAALGCSWQLIPQTWLHLTGAARGDGSGHRANSSMGTNQQSPMWSPRGAHVPVQLQGVRAGSSALQLITAPTLGAKPSESPRSWGAPWAPPYLFNPLARERQSMARRRRRTRRWFISTTWPRPGSAGAGSAAAPFLYQQVHPQQRPR